MEKGIELNNPAGFECGSNCEDKGHNWEVCDVVCNENGCQ